MSEDALVIDGFGAVEKDAIGEIMNITMGSAATAVSNMLSAKVWITTPEVSLCKAKELSFPELEPAILVRIKYTHGVSGQNVLVLKQNDVQLILAQLMGMPLEVTDDFEFDEMNISAVCEVMNQMMGSSATALSEIIDTPVDISTPEAIVQDANSAPISKMYEDASEDTVYVIKFSLTIDGVINSEFMSVLTIELAKEMAAKMLAGYNSDLYASADSSQTQNEEKKNDIPASEPKTASSPSSSGASLTQEQINAMLAGGVAPSYQQQAAPQQVPPMQNIPQGYAPPPQSYPQQPYYDPSVYGAMPGGAYQGQQPYPQQIPPYGYPPQQPQRNINVQAAQFQSFETYENAMLSHEQNDNLKLLMNVPLNVTVEIGSARKKVKDILDFTQGTIIELERQAGAPVDVIVNGNLIAKGDVVVIDDNFAVRITEIVKSKFLDNLGKE
jgi:flagellar motor switch protein FliN/FliY